MPLGSSSSTSSRRRTSTRGRAVTARNWVGVRGGHAVHGGHGDALGIFAVQTGGDEDLPGGHRGVAFHKAHFQRLFQALSAQDAGRAALLGEHGDAAARVGDEQDRGGMGAGPQHAAHKAHVGDDGGAGAGARGVAPVDGDAVLDGVGAHASGQDAGAHGLPGAVHGQLHQLAQPGQFRQILAVGDDAGLQFGHLGAQALVLFAHAHQIHIAPPGVHDAALDGIEGAQHRAAHLQADVGGDVIERVRALVPGIHAQKQHQKAARHEEKASECHSGTRESSRKKRTAVPEKGDGPSCTCKD